MDTCSTPAAHRLTASAAIALVLACASNAQAGPPNAPTGDRTLDTFLAAPARARADFFGVMSRACALEREEPGRFASATLPALQRALSDWPTESRYLASAGGPHDFTIDIEGSPTCMTLARELWISSRFMSAEAMRLLFHHPALANLERLHVDGLRVAHTNLSALTESAALGSLRHLAITQDSIGPDAIDAILDSPHLASVTSLDLGRNFIRSEGVAALAKNPSASRLRHLDLFWNDLRAGDVVALATSPHLAGLTSLNLSSNALCDDGVSALTGFLHLERLDISSDACVVRTRTLVDLVVDPAMDGLRDLDLSGLPLRDEGVTALAGGDGPARLGRLWVKGAYITHVGIAALATSPRVRTLESLNVHDNPIMDAGVVALATSPHLTSLARLYMGGTRVTHVGIEALGGAAFARRLEHLSLSGNGLGPRAATSVAGLDLPGLTHLDLSMNVLGDAGIETLVYAPSFQSLHMLHATENGVSRQMRSVTSRSRLGRRGALWLSL